MLDIWFEDSNELKSSSDDRHESFEFHLNNPGTLSDVLIFSNIEDDSFLRFGFASLKTHFHSNCHYKGLLRARTDKFVAQACYEFINMNDCLPAMISKSSMYPVIDSVLTQEEKLFKKVYVDKKVDLSTSLTNDEIAATGYLAVQKHYSEQQQWYKCEEHSYNFLRLGKLKNQLDVAESIIRDAEYIEFNINAIKHSDLNSNSSAPITGLSIEEACQLMKYAGMANNLRFLNISGYDSTIQTDSKIGECVAMMLWYFIEGRESRSDYFEGLNKTDFQEYLVQPSHIPIALKFFKHKVSGQWWVKLPQELNEKEMVLACSRRDYYQACNDEVSDRLMQALSVI